MSRIRFESTPYEINGWTVLHLPADASEKLPSRGQVMVKGTIDGHEFQTPLEPDGDWGHWFRVEDDLAYQSRQHGKIGNRTDQRLAGTGNSS